MVLIVGSAIGIQPKQGDVVAFIHGLEEQFLL
jgi:hypothetical protein